MKKVPAKVPNTAGVETPAVLMPYQQKWIAETSPFKVIEKSRRTGLTWAEAADNVLTAAASKAAGGQNVYYIAYNQDMTVEYIQACAMWARAFNHAAGEIEEGIWDDEADVDRNIKTFTICFPDSGFRIVALSSRPSNLRGRQGVIVIDEAAFHESLAKLLKAAMAMIIWGGRVHVISTHDGAGNPFAELVDEIRAGKQPGVVHRLTFAEAVTDGLYRRVCLRLGNPWSQAEEDQWRADVYAFYGSGAEEELDCVPSQGGGAYLSRALIESRMSPNTPVLRLDLPDDFNLLAEHIREAEVNDWLKLHVAPLLRAINPNFKSYYGFDFGRSGDLSVMIPLVQGEDLVCRPPFVLEMRNVPFHQQEQVLFYIVTRLPRFVKGAMDARGNGQYLAEVAVQKYGVSHVDAVMLSEGWYRENMPPFKAAFEDGTLDDLPRDSNILDDLRALQVVKGVARLPDTKNTGADGKKRHGDAAIGLALGIAAVRADGYEIGYTAVPKRQDEVDDDEPWACGFSGVV